VSRNRESWLRRKENVQLGTDWLQLSVCKRYFNWSWLFNTKIIDWYIL